MSTVIHGPRSTQARRAVLLSLVVSWCAGTAAGQIPAIEIPDAEAKSAAEMKPYTEKIVNAPVDFSMVPIAGGTFLMGSPQGEEGRSEDEGPQHEVQVDSFWMGAKEVTWDEYEVYLYSLDVQRRQVENIEPTPREQKADALTRPTKPYTDMTFGMGKEGYPAICMTQHAAKMYCKWLSEKTGGYYRLPTEAEWEYACRAGTKTAYSFGDDPEAIGDYAVFVDNCENELGDNAYAKVGTKKPNPWGLYDMHGNVAEWVIDAHDSKFYQTAAGKRTTNPLNPPKALYGRVVRGGSWDDDPELLRSAARRASEEQWKEQDPQIPQSIWYHTDALFVGFRVVRPLVEPTDGQKAQYESDPIQSVKQ